MLIWTSSTSYNEGGATYGRALFLVFWNGCAKPNTKTHWVQCQHAFYGIVYLLGSVRKSIEIGWYIGAIQKKAPSTIWISSLVFRCGQKRETKKSAGVFPMYWLVWQRSLKTENSKLVGNQWMKTQTKAKQWIKRTLPKSNPKPVVALPSTAKFCQT